MSDAALLHQSVDTAHLIQLALTPIFLISAIGVTLNVLTSRLARVVARARVMKDRVKAALNSPGSRQIHDTLAVLESRAGWISVAVTLI